MVSRNDFFCLLFTHNMSSFSFSRREISVLKKEKVVTARETRRNDKAFRSTPTSSR